ncbi:MAG: DegT/DnrJ/EryC1/StrS family aminotransferase [Armatimonadota bacterium]
MSTLALLGGPKAVTVRRASPVWPRFSPRAVTMVALMLYTGRGSTMGRGRMVMEAEAQFAKYHGVQYALAVSSGTASLHCALAGCGIEPGDEVITTPYTWGATTACILHHGAIPIFTDVLPDTGLLDPAQVEAKITRRTRAILVVHIYGQPAEMNALRAIARKHHLKLIDDVSQAHGAKYHGKLAGTQSDAAGFSCMHSKLVGAMELGMLLTNDRDAYDRALLLSQHASRWEAPPSEHGGGLRKEYYPQADSLGYNYRTTDIDCVLLLDQLRHLAEWNRQRALNRNTLVGLISDLDFLRFPRYPAEVEPAYHMITLNYYEEQAGGVTRETFMQALAAEGIDIFNYVPTPIPLWTRMQADAGPLSYAPWLRTLRDAGITYSADDLPVCLELTRKRAMQIKFNPFTVPEKKLLQQYANAFHKVAENLPDLLDLQRQRVAVAA